MMGHILGKEVIGRCLSPMTISPDEEAYLERRAVEILEGLERLTI